MKTIIAAALALAVAALVVLLAAAIRNVVPPGNSHPAAVATSGPGIMFHG
jgi:hypothetical protein